MSENILNPNDPRQVLDFCSDDNTLEAFAVTVYIIRDGKVLLMRQTKPNTVVPDSYVGIGGKTTVKTYLTRSAEKTNYDVVTSSLLSGKFDLGESMESLAVREVKEEVGLDLDQERLENIGMSSVRLLNPKTNEIWHIKNFIYYADTTEFNEEDLTDCIEGKLEFVPISELSQKPMLLHDKIILNEKNPSTYIESIVDTSHKVSRLRIKQQKGKQVIYVLLPDGESNPHKVYGVLTETTEEIPETYSKWVKDIPKEKLKEFLESLGILEQEIGRFGGEDCPIDLDI